MVITVVFCHSCGKENDDASNFCIYCGNKLIKDSIKCSKCGEINEINSNFCINCGNNLKDINKSTREEYEQEIGKLKDLIKSNDFNMVSINGETIGNEKIEKENPHMDEGEVKFKSMESGIDVGKIIIQKINDDMIEKYGTAEEKAELNERKRKDKLKIEERKYLFDKFKEASDLFIKHNYEDAIPIYREIIDNSNTYDETVYLSYTDLSSCYEFLNDYDSAISVINEHIEVKKEFNEDYADLETQIEKLKKSEKSHGAKELREKGLKLFYSGNYDEAIPLFRECVNLDDDDSKTYDRLTDIYIAKRDFESAKEVLEKGIENVTWEYALQNEHKTGLKDRLENINNYLETGVLTGEKMPIDSESVKSEIKNAKTILKEEDKEKGIELLENIIKKGTYNNTAYYTLYQTYMKDKKYDDAIRISDLAIEYLGLFDQGRLEKWNKYKDKAIAKKEKELSN